jgi:4-diphosphocytidyl-2-C-methyl-D-erythritol kinase
VEGIGEALQPISVPAMRLAVVKPPDSLPTKAIFESPLLQRSQTLAIVAGSFGSTWKLYRNDLQAAAQSQSQQVVEATSKLERVFGNSRMTGSGSAVFSEVDSEAQPEATRLEQFLELPEHWVGRLCRSLESMPLAGWIPS